MELNPKTQPIEFGGPAGVLCLALGLPIFTVFLNQMVRPDYFIRGFFYNFDFAQLWNGIKPWHYYLTCYDLWTYYAIWFVSLAVLDVILPGKHMQGLPLRDGTKLPYKINGIAICSALGLVLAARWALTGGQMPELQFLYSNHTDLCVITILFALVLSIICYVASFVPLLRAPNGVATRERILATPGNTGNCVYDWFLGRELNPRLGPLDVKLFCELRPGMLLWLLINLSCLHHDFLQTGRFNNSLLLINILQGLYILDGVLNEEGVLSMIDVTTDGFGFMLAFGDLTLVPFTYSLQSRYLSVSPLELSQYEIAAIVGVMSLGFYIFKASNHEKSMFRAGKLPHLQSIQTETGTALLCDSWWSLSQHINYFGDWLISLSWCLATGFQTPLTYYYSFYFATLLLHRQQRDSHKCHSKYGANWQEYEAKVPYKIVPYVY